MVIKRISFTATAKRRLQQIYDYKAVEHSKSTAEKFRLGVAKKLRTLLNSVGPKIGQEEGYLIHLGKGHHYLLFDKYKIIYFTVEELAVVTDIFHTSQDPDTMEG